MEIKFSVIIPLYNKEKQIQKTIESVLKQTYTSFELVVVNDGSTDSSMSIVESYNDTRVKLISKKNGGVSSARNYGIEQAINPWIVPLDADDSLLPNALQTLAQMIEMFPNERYFSGRTKWGNNCRGTYAYIVPKKTRFPLFMIWLKKVDPAPRDVVFHKSLIQKYGNYDERMSFYEDYEFSIRLACCGSIVYTDSFLAEYIQDGQGLSAGTHPIEKEMAYYIPEYVETASFWHKALLYENLEMEILWWQQHGNEENVKFYQDMQKTYFGRIFRALHWVRQKMICKGII